jgi:DNA-binding transcriptional LysR family regulator
MNYEVYKDLYKLKEVKIFTLAAEERGCLQSTISRRILSEEKSLDCKLYDRKSQEITFAGKIYLKYGAKLRSIEQSLTEYVGKEKWNDKLLDFRAFSYVFEISRTENITRAAENLYISQPALSQYLYA